VAARANDPWFIWLKYFVANRAVEFTPKTNTAADQLSATLNFLSGNKDQQAATLMLFAEAFSRPSDARTKLAAQFIAKWLDPVRFGAPYRPREKLGGLSITTCRWMTT
jgi:hypothetical protein